MYDLIPQAPHPSMDPDKIPAETPVDGVLGSIQPSSAAKPTKKPNSYATTPSTPKVSAEVNAIQSMQTPRNKKKGKGKNKKPGNQQENLKYMATHNDNKGKINAKYLFLLCGGDHFTKGCPRCEDISKFLKSNPTPAVLTNPFPSQQQLIDHMSNQGTSSSTE